MSDELVYVSWGGTGRAATLRAAMERAAAADSGLLYLAILDDAAFADLDDAFLDVVKDELQWLLTAQLDVTRSQVGVEELAVRVLIRGGDIVEEVADVVATLGDTEVIIGAPVPPSGYESVDSLLETIRGRVSAPLDVLNPASDGA